LLISLLEFRRDLMWITQGDLHRARMWLGAAHCRLPAYAAAQGHLAEAEAALGETDSAIARLRPLTISSDDLILSKCFYQRQFVGDGPRPVRAGSRLALGF
jgi:hypothetical protein